MQDFVQLKIYRRMCQLRTAHERDYSHLPFVASLVGI